MKNVLRLAAVLGIISVGGCNRLGADSMDMGMDTGMGMGMDSGTDAKFQGPLNLSFEEAGPSSACGSAGIPEAANWGPFCVNRDTLGPYPIRRDGTSFMPTDGIYFMALPAGNGILESGILQDNVDFSTSTELLFDYEAVGMVATGTVSAGSATFQILFTSMGTITLWSKTYPVGMVNEQVRDVVVAINRPPTAGRLTIQASVTNARNTGVGAVDRTILEVRLDNLRVIPPN